MARYFFDTEDGGLVHDDVGIECSDLQEVRAQAAAGLADLARELLPGTNYREMTVRVRNDQGEPVTQMTVRLEVIETKS